jgi:hypothetical protein
VPPVPVDPAPNVLVVILVLTSTMELVPEPVNMECTLVLITVLLVLTDVKNVMLLVEVVSEVIVTSVLLVMIQDTYLTMNV